MTDKNQNHIQLSRRTVLGGLGAIGIAAGGAGIGTNAFFTDTEPVGNNTLAAGRLNLVVDYFTAVDQGSAGKTSDSGTVSNSYSLVLKDLKPGDSGTVAFCPKLISNAGWLWVGSNDGIVDFENGQTEPETDVDSTGGNPGQGNGELSDAIQVDLSYCKHVSLSGDTVTANTLREFNNPAHYTLADLFKDLKSGFLLDGEDVTDGTTDPYPGSSDANDQQGPCICIDWTVPTDVGNEIQTDSVEFTFTFVAVQSRNNANPSNPFVDLTVGTGSGFDFNSIQAAVDNASPGDVISVSSGTYNEQVTIDTMGVSLVAARGTTPTVNGSGSSPVISVEADGVTIDGFAITNPGQLLGIKVDVGIDDVTICNNRIYEVGPTGNLGVSGIIVGQGDHTGIQIVGNTIEDLEQVDNGSFATLNGILFDADNNNPATITDTIVSRNTIRRLESTTAPLGIVVQHQVTDLTIAKNEISKLTADNSLGPGSFTTFAQGISIDSPSTTGFEIVDNTSKEIVSEDGFFAEDIKIEPTADVSGINVHRNNLLSAIGLNNANGNNPTVAAERNFWGSPNGPIEILNNDDDGDVPTGNGDVDLDTVPESAVTKNVDYKPFATSSQ